MAFGVHPAWVISLQVLARLAFSQNRTQPGCGFSGSFVLSALN